MAFPIAFLIALASSLGSSILNEKAAEKVAKQQNLYTDMENTRQDALREKAQANFKDLLNSQQKTSQDEDMAAQENALKQRYGEAANTINFQELLPGQGSASNTVRMDVVGAGSRAQGKANQRANARAALDAYGQTALNNAIKDQRAKENLGMISNESRGSYDILPLEMKASQNKGASLRGWANLLSTVGSVASSAAAASAMKTAATPGPLGGESAMFNMGNFAVTPSLDLYRTMPAVGYGPIQPVKTSWTSLLTGR